MKAVVVILILVLISGGLIFKSQNGVDFKNAENTSSPVSSSEPTPNAPVDIEAEFEIITNGIVRIFTDQKYHNLSPFVYIDDGDPTKVKVKQSGITWDDFFKTLPMSLNKNCLVTGTKQTFCTNNTRSLKFYINSTEDPNALDKEIKNGSTLEIIFR